MTHPSYPNPTIIEALCEVHFKLGAGVPWSPSVPGALWKEVADEYPDIEPITETGVSFRLGRQGEIEQVITERKKYKFTHQTKKKFIQISENIFTINVLAPYPGWDTMKRDVLQVWSTTRRVIEPTAIMRIGLRYINKIQRRSPNELASFWLQETDFLPRRVLNSQPPFLLRLESKINDHDRSLVTLVSAGEDKPFGSIVFDIDCIKEAEAEIKDAAVGTSIENLHDVIWSIFSSAKTDNLLTLLKGGTE